MAKAQKKTASRSKSVSTYTIVTTTLAVLLLATSVFMFVSMRHLNAKVDSLSDEDAYDTAQRDDSIN